LRLLSSEAALGEDAVTLPEAWAVYATLLASGRFAFTLEPPGIDPLWERFCRPFRKSPKVVMDAYLAAFAKAGTEILGVSADPVQAQDKFKSKHKLKIALASDEAKKMLEAYGAWGEKSMYGRKYMGVIRKTFLIDGKGRIVLIWPKVSVPGHAEKVLEAAKAL
jgi:hypothetical protein